MRNVDSIVESLEFKIVKVLAHLDALKTENERLKSEIASLKEKAKAQRAALDKKDADLEALRIASSMLGSNDDKRASKLKINALIRDINDCLASLSD